MRIRRALLPVLLLLLSTIAVTTAHAEVTTELTARWDPSPPASVTSGTLVTGEFRVDLNDPATGADGVRDNLTVRLDLTHGRFRSIPELCRNRGADPISSITADGRALICNLGTVRHGTAEVIEFGAMADGENGDALQAVLSTPGAPAVTLPPVPITALAALEVTFDVNYPAGESALDTVHPKFPFGISVPAGAAALDGPIEFDVTITDGKGASARDLLEPDGAGCAEWKDVGGSIPESSPEAPLPGTCVVTRTSPGVFHVLLNGYRKNPWDAPPTLSAGNGALPTDRAFFAVGALTLRTSRAPSDVVPGDFTFTATAGGLHATTRSGTTIATDWQPDNDTETRLYTTPGHGQIWLRVTENEVMFDGEENAILGQGTSWDGTPVAAAGGTVIGAMKSGVWEGYPVAMIPKGQTKTVCSTVDSPADTEFTGRIAVNTGTVDPGTMSVQVLTTPVTGSDFTCAGSGWRDVAVTDLGDVEGGALHGRGFAITGVDPASVTAVRVSVDPAALKPGETVGGALTLWTVWRIATTAAEGTDVWILGSGSVVGTAQMHHDEAAPKVATPGDRYPATNHLRDVLHVTRWVPFVDKTVSTPNPDTGDTVEYTIRSGLRNPAYAQDSGDYTVTDTMPAGVRLVEASPRPAPTSITHAPDGSTRLVWDLRDIAVNADQVITYDAVVELPHGTAVNTARVDTTDRPGYRPTVANHGIDDAAIAVVRSGRTVLSKHSSQEVFALDAPDHWVLDLHNDDDVDQAVTDVIDILPWVGDGRGSRFSGGFTLGEVTVSHREKVLFTGVDPSRLSPDPDHPGNGGFGAPSSIWTTTRPTGRITALRIIGANLPVGATATTDITWTPTGARAGDRYVNYAWARSTHTELRMIRAADSVVVADPTTLQVDKQSAATEARPGVPITYLISARNAGPRPAHAVTVTDRPGFGLDAASLQAATPSRGTWDRATRLWTIGDLGVGEVETLEVTIAPAAGYDRSRPVRNSVVIGSPHNPAPDGPACVANDVVEADTDQCDRTSVPPALTRLALNKKALRVTTAEDGRTGTVDWLVEVRNNGPGDASGVVVSEDLPAGVTAADTTVLGSPSRGVWMTVSHHWRIGDLRAGAVATLRLRTTHPMADLRAGVINRASVSAAESPYRGGRQTNPDLDADVDQYDHDRAVRPPLTAGPVVAPPLPDAGGPGRLAALGGVGATLIGLLLLRIGQERRGPGRSR